eukprot:1291732-Rhodomonas_salina.1
MPQGQSPRAQPRRVLEQTPFSDPRARMGFPVCAGCRACFAAASGCGCRWGGAHQTLQGRQRRGFAGWGRPWARNGDWLRRAGARATCGACAVHAGAQSAASPSRAAPVLPKPRARPCDGA